jgi:hypothetical protein
MTEPESMVERIADAIAQSLNGALEDWDMVCARAALQAIRSPTEEMVDALQDFMANDGRAEAVWAWQAAIDAALK